MKKVLVMWIVVAVLLVGSLTGIGFYITKKNKPYKALEDNLRESAMGYYGQYINALPKKSVKITNEELSDKDYGVDLKNGNEVCKGYVIINNVMGMYEYEPYIKCDSYSTRGYEE